MADTPTSANVPDDMHWGISYLREDLQDLRLEMRSVNARFDSMNTRIDQVVETLTRRIDSRFSLLLTAMIALSGIVIAANFAVLKLYLPPQ